MLGQQTFINDVTLIWPHPAPFEQSVTIFPTPSPPEVYDIIYEWILSGEDLRLGTLPAMLSQQPKDWASWH
jgi:hypothetical protein